MVMQVMRCARCVLCATLLATMLAVCAYAPPALAFADAGAQLAAGSAKSAAADPSTVAAQSVDYDIAWYTGDSDTYTIKNVAQLKGLSHLVNGTADIDGDGKDDEAVSFEGATVQLPGSLGFIIFFDEADTIEPIGTPETPFEGTFDGRGGTIGALNLDVGNRLSYIGLFGYASDKATIKNLRIAGTDESAVSVSNGEAGKSISHVGAIAGHLGGDIEGCWSSLDVSVTNDGAVPSKKGTVAEDMCTILYIGGLVGSLGGDMEGCTHADATLSIASSADVNDDVPYIAGFVGGIAGYQGDESDAGYVPVARNCKNSGPVSFNVTGVGGIDRFGSQMYSKSTMVGGIVGYEMGDVVDCSNTAAVHTGIKEGGVTQAGWGASNVGGIAGSLRGPTVSESASATGVVGSNQTDPGYSVWTKSNGADRPATIGIERCANTGEIAGLASVAGICGSTGAFTRIVACSNAALVEGTRWNKPCPAGIVGISNGDIAYCYNQGRCFSTTGGGFYSSGIAALLTTYNTSATAVNLLLEAPELYGCYVTGSIGGESAGYKTAVLAGENDGFIHDNCFLPNLTVDKAKDKDAFGDEELHSRLVAQGENRGTMARNYELSADEMRSGLAVARLNYPGASKGDWSMSYATVSGQFPVLSWQAGGQAAGKVDLASVVTGASLGADPAYSADHAPIPEITLQTSDGSTLYQGADYRVVVDESAKEIGPEYEATIEGINGFTGTLENKVAYHVQKADIGTCTVSAQAQVYTGEVQRPKNVTVRDDAGNVVDSSEYTVTVPVNEDGSTAAVKGKYYDYVNCHGSGYRYDVTVEAKDDSAHYTGSATQAAFQIKWASLFMGAEEVDDPNKEEDVVLGNVVWNDQEWDIKQALKTKGYVKVKYTGSEIKPKFKSVTYLGKELRDGTTSYNPYKPLESDYKYVYGNPNPTEGSDGSVECVDVTGSDETKLACVTVRYTEGGNFQNYTNMFYEITPASISDDVALSGVAKSYIYTGSAIAPSPKLTYNGMTLKQGIDYTLSYKNNKAAGTASATVTGKGNYAGSKTVTFKIAKANSSIAIAAQSKTYTGKALAYSGKVTKKGSTGKVSFAYYSDAACRKAVGAANVKAAGTYYVKATVAADANHNASTSGAAKFTIAKAKQPMVVKAQAKKVALSKVKKKAQTVASFKLGKAQGAVTCKNVSTDKVAKKFKVNAKGKVRLPKGIGKGTYKVKVKFTAKGNKNYAAGTKTVTAVVKVK